MKTITYEQFSKRVSELWAEDRHKYGSVQFPCREALSEFQESGVTNAQQMYDEYYKRHRSTFHYAGD